MYKMMITTAQTKQTNMCLERDKLEVKVTSQSEELTKISDHFYHTETNPH